MNLDKLQASFLALGLFAGMIGGAALLGNSIKESRNSERYVTVRGVAERSVKADLVIWPIKVQASGDVLSATNTQADEARAKALKFIVENGIQMDDVASQTYASN